jgi:hypothetical protein
VVGSPGTSFAVLRRTEDDVGYVMEKLEIIRKVQTRLSDDRDLAELKPRAALSFNEERLVVQYRHPRTGRDAVVVVGSLQELMLQEQRLLFEVMEQLKRLKAG